MIDHEFLGLKLAERMKRLREERGRSRADVAAATGIPEAQLADFEESRAEPAVGQLLGIGSFLDVGIDHFFQTQIADKRVELVRAGERWTVPPKSEAAASLNYRYQALSHGLTDKLMEPFLVEVPPGQPGSLPKSAHEGEEFIFLLSGRLEVEVGDEVFHLEPGDALYYDSRLEHVLRAVEGSAARLIACVAQARRSRSESPLDRAYR